MTPQKVISCRFFKMDIFSKFFGDFMTHMIRENAGKKMKKFWFFFSIKNLGYTFVSFSSPHSLFVTITTYIICLGIYFVYFFRCNLGGDNTCYYSCVALGYSNGMCDENDNCNCGGGNNRWGNLLQNVRDRLWILKK